MPSHTDRFHRRRRSGAPAERTMHKTYTDTIDALIDTSSSFEGHWAVAARSVVKVRRLRPPLQTAATGTADRQQTGAASSGPGGVSQGAVLVPLPLQTAATGTADREQRARRSPGGGVGPAQCVQGRSNDRKSALRICPC